MPIYLSLCKKEKISEEVFLTFLGGGDNLNNGRAVASDVKRDSEYHKLAIKSE